MDFIVLTEEFEYRVNARNIIKAVLKNEKGEPILRKNLIPKISDTQISEDLNAIADEEELQRLPDVGQEVVEGVLYQSEWGLIKCRQTHNRTIYDPIDVPALFSFYRGDDESLEWIQNEYVYVGWKRVYEGIPYEVIQEHLTLSTWTPDVTPALWLSLDEPGDEYPVYKPVTGAHDVYMKDAIVWYPALNDTLYISTIDNNSWAPGVYGWIEFTP